MTQSARKSLLGDPSLESGFMYSNGEFSEVVTPLVVDLNDIFDDKLTIVIEKFVKKETKLAVQIGMSPRMHSLTGTVFSVKECSQGFEIVLDIDFIPDGLLKDLEEVLTISHVIAEDPWE